MVGVLTPAAEHALLKNTFAFIHSFMAAEAQCCFTSITFFWLSIRLSVGEVDYKEIGDCVHVSGYSSTDLCLPALDYLRKCSQVCVTLKSVK